MVKISDTQGRRDQAMVVEDPRPNNDGFYLQGTKVDKTSMTPQYERTLNYNQRLDAYWEFRVPGSRGNGSHLGSHLALSKTTGAMGNWTADGDGWENTPCSNSYVHMEPELQSPTIYDWVQNGRHQVMHNWNNGATDYAAGWAPSSDSVDLDQVFPSALGYNSAASGTIYAPATHWYPELFGDGGVNSTYMVGLPQGSNRQSQMYNYPSQILEIKYGTFPDSFVNQTALTPTGMGSTSWAWQFLGKSAIDGGLIIAAVNCESGSTGNQLVFTKCKWTNNVTPVYTVLYTNTVTPAAGGTSVGGYVMNNKQLNRNFSQVFPHPTDANKKCFYHNYYDTYYNFHPELITWDTTTDTFTRESDITCDVLSSVHADYSSITWHVNSTYRTMKHNIQTWESGGNRYVSAMPFDGKGSYWDSNEAFRTWLVYQVDPADPKNLTYHSKMVVPTTPRTMIWLNDSHTLMGVWFKENFRIYTFNTATGWVETSTIQKRVYNVGRDSLDRIWYTNTSSTFGDTYLETHMLTPSLPVTITIASENADYTYAGVNINTFVNVSAYNASGARIATSVKLVIEGSSMTFSDSTTTKIVTTSASTDLQVNTIVTGAGFTNIAASITI
jgi:hypothetical protein